ncbi:MAG: ExbD/TolR family protein [Fimbriiglobus sp.]
MSWLIRKEGSTRASSLPTPQAILDAVKDGDWDATDEIRGPGEKSWRAIEAHPAFEEAIAELEAPPPPPEEETHLDMNPLIDVALVLLIFFILTATYATLRRTVELPAEPPEEQTQKSAVPKLKDIQDRIFKVTVRMEDENTPVVRVENKVVALNDLEAEFKDWVKNRGRKEAYIDVGPDVLWGVEIKVLEATRGAEVQRIHWPRSKR